MSRLLRALPALLLWAAGCEAIVAGQLGSVHCEEDGKVGPPACPVAFECRAGLCVPSELGATCASDADCAPGDLCLDPHSLGASGEKTCSRACCTSSDCDPQEHFVCWTPPSGAGSFCRDGAALSRAPGGTRKAWEACAADGDCRSGRCLEQRCADTCCSDTSCAEGGGVCRFGHPAAADAIGFWCAAPPEKGKARYAPCEKDEDCASGLCLDLGAGLRCSAPCCGSASCETLDKSIPVRCMTVTRAGAVLRACGAVVKGMANHAVGEPCAEDGDCRSGACADLGGQKQCSDLCCSDESCGDPSSFACRPGEIESAWALRCGPK